VAFVALRAFEYESVDGGHMTDRCARDAGADALRGFMEGRLSNRDYEKQFPSSRTDGALRAIHVAVWFTYSDVREQFVGRGLTLSDDQRTLIGRCVLFLESDCDFAWPLPEFRLRYGIARMLGRGRALDRVQARQMSVGDISVWPFLDAAQLAEAERTRTRSNVVDEALSE
jgi:hypothetical protein